MDKTNIDFLNTLYTELKKRRGTMKSVMQKSGRKRNWIRLVLQGQYKDERVVIAAAEVLRELKQKENEAFDKARKILKDTI